MSRRRFTRQAGGTAAAVAAFSGLWGPAAAAEDEEDRRAKPVPIPGRSPALGGQFHVFGPTPDGSLDPIDAEPSTITNLNGFVGLSYTSGTVRQTNTATGEVLKLPFVDSDMRFMKGVFRGTDGKMHRGAFAFI
jgi:hypothetical protein